MDEDITQEDFGGLLKNTQLTSGTYIIGKWVASPKQLHLHALLSASSSPGFPNLVTVGAQKIAGNSYKGFKNPFIF